MVTSLIVFPVGKKIFWQGYYVESDGGSNWGLVTSGAGVNDGGSEFTLADGQHVVANLKGDKVNALKFGVKVQDSTFDSLPALSNLNAFVKNTTASTKQSITLPSGGIYISDTFNLEREVTYVGQGAKVTTFRPHSTWDNTGIKWIIQDDLLATPDGTADNNFFGIRRDFGTRNDDSIENIGCLWARAGGGSNYENMFLADAFGAETLRVSGRPPSEGGDGGAVVATSFRNIWLANTGANPGSGLSGSRARNGLLCDNAFSTSFYNLIVDYQSNATDYIDPTNDTDGFGIKLDNCQVNFYGTNMEGNHKPISCTSAQNSAFYGGAIYRKGLGSQTPNTDPDFIFRNASQASMSSMMNFYASQGYGESNGGGVGVNLGSTTSYGIKTRGDLNTVSGGGFSYLNDNNLNVRSLTSLDAIETPLELEVGTSGLFITPLSRAYKGVYRAEYSATVAQGSGTVDIPLNGHGRLLVLSARSDQSNSNRGDVIDAIYNAEVPTGQVSITSQLLDSASVSFITGLSVVDDGFGGAALRVSYNATTYDFNLTVIFEGRTSKNITI